MTVFKTFWKIVNKYKGTIILYTVMLISFGGINLASNDTTTTFTSTLPNIAIVNNDQKSVLTNNLISYLSENSKVVDIENDEEKINDALFYRDVSYVVYIPKNYTNDVLKGMNPTIDIKSTNDYTSSLEEMMLTDYLNLQNTYLKLTTDQAKLTNYINDTLKDKSEVVLTSKVDTKSLSKVSRYFNFASYSILAVVIFIITLVLTSFKEKTVNKRIVVSSMNYKKYNKYIMLSSIIYVLFVVILYTILGFIVFGNIMFSKRGLIYILNTFIFAIVALALSLLVSTLVNKKEAVSGIVNVVSLSQAFLCGAFIPVMWMPDSVLKLAHVFPAYYYINSNELLASLEVLNFSNLKPIFINMGLMILFIVIFIILNNIFSKKKQVLR